MIDLKPMIAGGLLFGLAAPVHADSGRNFSAAAGDSADASARLTASGVQVATGAVAVPITIAGIGLRESGAVTAEVGEALFEAANAPLVVDDAVVVAAPAPSVPRTVPPVDGEEQ